MTMPNAKVEGEKIRVFPAALNSWVEYFRRWGKQGIFPEGIPYSGGTGPGMKNGYIRRSGHEAAMKRPLSAFHPFPGKSRRHIPT